MTKIAAVVVTYNRKALLEECLEAILNQKFSTCDVVVVDNCSTDGTGDFVKGLSNHRIVYRNTGKNLGGAGGFNYGMRLGTELGYEYLWIMDDDCIPTDTALNELLKAQEKVGDFGFLSSKVLWKDGSVCLMNRQRRTMYKNIDVEGTTGVERIVMASFVSFLLPTSVIRELGLPIKEFFIWTDDWEFSRRISRKYRCYFVNSSVVVHKSDVNMAANIAKESPERLFRFNYMYRNEVFLYRREGVAGWGYVLLRFCYHLLKVLAKSKEDRVKRITIIWQGLLTGLSFNPKIEYVEE